METFYQACAGKYVDEPKKRRRIYRPTEKGGGGQPGRRPGAHEFKQVESYCLNHNSSIHFCCTDSLLMTHRGGLSCVSLFGELEEGGKFAFVLEPKNSLGSPVNMSII